MGTKSQKKAKTRLDAYYRLAKDQGYRARSAFKLIQLNRKYDFLAKARSLVDLCAAPGGWCQVAAKHMPLGSKIVGVDLVPIAPIRGVKTFVGDITDDRTRKVIMTYLKKEPVDAVIHDGAPNVGGVWAKDLFAQNALVLASLKMAVALLKVGGWYVSKVFRSPDYHKILWVMRQFFDKVEASKPLSSRMESAEIFVVCGGFKAPKQVDPKLFSAQHVFSEVAQEKVMLPSGALVTPKSNVPEGYDDFNTILSKQASMSDFLAAEDPKSFLREYHTILFPDADRPLLQSKHSRKELVYLCQDLQQVSEGDRRKLIRWRDQLIREGRRRLAAEEEANEDEEFMFGAADEAATGAAAATGEGDTDDDDAEAIAGELLALRKKREKDIKKKEKRVVDRKLKQVRGLINYDPHENAAHPTDMGGHAHAAAAAMGGAGADGGVEELGNDTELSATDWAMASLKAVDERRLATLMDKHYVVPDAKLNLPLNAVTDVNIDNDEEIDMGKDKDDDPDAPQREDETLHVEEGNEEAYDVDAHGNYIYADRSARVAQFDVPGGVGQSESDFSGDEDPEAARLREKQERRAAKDESDYAVAGKQAKWMRRHLNVDRVLNRTFPKPRDPKRKKNAEEDVVEMGGAVGGDTAVAMAGGKGTGKAPAARGHRQGENFEDDTGDDSDDFSDVSSLGSEYPSDDEDRVVKQGRADSRRKKAIVPDVGKLTAAELTKQQRKQVLKENKEKRKQRQEQQNRTSAGGKKNKKGGKEDTTFEEIPVAMTDPDVRARTMAMATAMLDKRKRNEMQDNALNKFMNNDDDDLPDWFVKDEQRNCTIELPVTAAEIESQRRRFMELNARPSKKIMEAMGRKRRKAQRMLRGLIEKGKSDPRARDKSSRLSVRKLMRSTQIKGQSNKKKNQPMDNMAKGQKKRERARVNKSKKGGGKKGRR